VPPFGWPSPRRNSEYIRFSGTLLFLISKSEEQADDHQKQNPVTSSARSGSDLKLKTESKGLASREHLFNAGFELELVGAERYTVRPLDERFLNSRINERRRAPVPAEDAKPYGRRNVWDNQRFADPH
jgi:hypothetical protein